jgi:hypothetical protein
VFGRRLPPVSRAGFTFLTRDPGAYAPGFMLSLASRACSRCEGQFAYTNRLAFFQICIIAAAPCDAHLRLDINASNFRLPHTSPRVWGWGRRRWALVRGPSLTPPLFVPTPRALSRARRGDINPRFSHTHLRGVDHETITHTHALPLAGNQLYAE